MGIVPGAFTGHFKAPLHLPNGALVTEIEAVLCDVDESLSLATVLVIQPRMAPPITATGPSTGQVESPGCVDRTVVLNPPVLVDNNANSYHFDVALFVGFALQFASARIGYVLQVSPPVGQRFDDVPPGHPFFPFIQALAVSGITGGCSASPPLFCPDDVVTREQMAAFLARALGLHWAP
jgi:hypothetical protein